MFKLLRRVVFLAIVLGVLAFGLGWSVDALARKGIEQGGAWALGVPVTVGSAGIGLVSGDVSMAGLRVDNPSGFSGDPFLSVVSLTSRVPLANLLGDKVEIPEVGLRGIRISLEQSLSRSNWSVITDHLKRFETGDKKPESAGKRFIVRELVIEDIKVGVAVVPLAGAALKQNLDIPPIRLRDVGAEGNEGVLLGELAAVVVEAVLGAVAAQGAGVLPASTAADLASSVRGLMAPGGPGAVIENALKNMQSDPAKALQGLGDVLGGRKK